MMFERHKRIRLFACLPLQLGIFLLSTVLVVRTVSTNNLQTAMLDNSNKASPRRLRQTPSAISLHAEHQKKQAVIESMRKMYEGEKLDQQHVHQILRDGKQVLSLYDTIYDIPMPKINLEEDPQFSKKGITVSHMRLSRGLYASGAGGLSHTNSAPPFNNRLWETFMDNLPT